MNNFIKIQTLKTSIFLFLFGLTFGLNAQISVTFETNAPTCNGYTNGQVDIEIVGGTAPYTYQWHDGQTTKDLFGVAGGPYSLTVTDASGCTTTLDGDLGQPDAIQVTETLMNGACGEKGAIDIFVSGGIPPYQYNWNTGATTEDLTNLDEGTYSITITDGTECTLSRSFDIMLKEDSLDIELIAIDHPNCDREKAQIHGNN